MILFVPALAQAEFYLRPRAGAAIPMDGGDVAYSLGVTTGYQWTSFLATEVSYARLISSGNAADGDVIRGEGIVSLPGLPVVTPYVSGGVGTVHYNSWNMMLVGGAGVTFQKLLFFQLGAGISYAAVQNHPDFLEPYVSVAIVF